MDPPSDLGLAGRNFSRFWDIQGAYLSWMVWDKAIFIIKYGDTKMKKIKKLECILEGISSSLTAQDIAQAKKSARVLSDPCFSIPLRMFAHNQEMAGNKAKNKIEFR
jgi:hypothetical protein